MITLSLKRSSSRALQAALALLLAFPLAVLLDKVARAPAITDRPQRAYDQRPAGERAIADAQRRLAAAPDEPRAMTSLAAAYLQRARETGDPTYYPRADELLGRALASDPNDVHALVALGSLALSRHEFPEALSLGQRAVQLAPDRPAAYGVLTDAFVELGRYDEAVEAAQRMVDLRPDQPSLSRVSYLRELHGDLTGAVEAMSRAVRVGAPVGEAAAWSEAQLGNLLFAQGKIDEASSAYGNATRRVDDYVYGLAGVARVRAAGGDLRGAADLYEAAARRMPLPDLVMPLADLYLRLGDPVALERHYELVSAIQKLMAANGVRADIDMALFNADHGLDLGHALEVAKSEYLARPTVKVADTLAWTEYLTGDLESASIHSRQALRLGTRDPLMLYRAGVIAQANGESDRAYPLLKTSNDLNPTYSILWAHDLAARMRALPTSDQAPPP